MNAEVFIARRIGSSGAMVRIAVATGAVSMAVMILAVAVIMGFRSEIAGKISAFAGHLKVHGGLEGMSVKTDEGFEEVVRAFEGVVSVEPYALKGGIVKTDEATQGIVLKGVRDSLEGRDVLISSTLGRLLKLGEGDKVEMLFVGGERPVRRDLFKVGGLYVTGLEEMDNRFAITDIANIQRLNGWESDRAEGYEIVLDGMEWLGEVQGKIRGMVGEGVVVSSVMDEYPQLFDWLATHDVNAAVIITIMIVVALISCVSAVLIIVLERIKMIGILKTLGMRTGALRRIFLMRAARILALGLLIGTAVGVGLALLQKQMGLVKLDASGYFLSVVPIELNAGWIVALNVGTFVVILALLVLPTSIVGRVSPEKTIRYE